jgi:DMSO/TMAO reductase YedYZ molybdopterin-dependent catalytic subunit
MDQPKQPQGGGGGPVAERVPANQRLAVGFPILHEGEVPFIDMKTWDLKVWGLGDERRFSWADFMALPQTKVISDFHCVTGWTKLDNVWEGVRFTDFLNAIHVKPEARYVMAYGHLGDDPMGYSTNIPLDVLRNDDVLLAHRHNGQPLTPDHGYPLRLVVPERYAWKSAKWIRGLEFMAEDRRGYWEVRGYHNNAEPFAEERYTSQERPQERHHIHGKDDT